MTGGDACTPAAVDRPGGDTARAFRGIADHVMEALAIVPAGAAFAGEEGG